MPVPNRSSLVSLALTAVLTLGGCTSGATQTEAASQVKPAVAPAPAPQTFGEWQASFRARALSAGIAPQVFDAAFRGVSLNSRVQELDTRQPEFSRPIWEYLDSAVSDSRVQTGRDKRAGMADPLGRIEARYGVDREIVLAIWAIESGYGGNFGNIPVVESLATLAYDGRRKAFAEEQLIAALRILQAGDITPARMVGSWAGAMGHTQFIPTSFLEYAVDFTGDGRRDLWAPDAVDALASTANYLNRFGWRQGAPAVREIRLPGNFDYLLADGRTTRSAADWQALGISGQNGPLPAAEEVSILLPAGARGPAFAVYPNFGVIKRYNNSTSYAMAVAYLAERIRGGPRIVADWPRGDRTLSRTEKQELQSLLTSLGFDTKGVDGIIGPNSRSAVRQFQQSRGLVPDGYVSAALLQAVRTAAAG